MRKCPVCNQLYRVSEDMPDHIHTCTKGDWSTPKTENELERKWAGDNWNRQGMNVYPHKKSEKDMKNNIYKKWPIRTYENYR